MTLDRVQRALDAHGIRYEREGNAIISLAACIPNGDGTFTEVPEKLTVENGVFHVDGNPGSLMSWLGY